MAAQLFQLQPEQDYSQSIATLAQLPLHMQLLQAQTIAMQAEAERAKALTAGTLIDNSTRLEQNLAAIKTSESATAAQNLNTDVGQFEFDVKKSLKSEYTKSEAAKYARNSIVNTGEEARNRLSSSVASVAEGTQGELIKQARLQSDSMATANSAGLSDLFVKIATQDDKVAGSRFITEAASIGVTQAQQDLNFHNSLYPIKLQQAKADLKGTIQTISAAKDRLNMELQQMGINQTQHKVSMTASLAMAAKDPAMRQLIIANADFLSKNDPSMAYLIKGIKDMPEHLLAMTDDQRVSLLQKALLKDPTNESLRDQWDIAKYQQLSGVFSHDPKTMELWGMNPRNNILDLPKMLAEKVRAYGNEVLPPSSRGSSATTRPATVDSADGFTPTKEFTSTGWDPKIYEQLPPSVVRTIQGAQKNSDLANRDLGRLTPLEEKKAGKVIPFFDDKPPVVGFSSDPTGLEPTNFSPSSGRPEDKEFQKLLDNAKALYGAAKAPGQSVGTYATYKGLLHDIFYHRSTDIVDTKDFAQRISAYEEHIEPFGPGVKDLMFESLKIVQELQDLRASQGSQESRMPRIKN